jgi:hypothetical protein
VNNGQII